MNHLAAVCVIHGETNIDETAQELPKIPLLCLGVGLQLVKVFQGDL